MQVGILIDQNTTPAEGVFIDFFGRKACAGTAFVKFAHHTGAAVVPGYALWSDLEEKPHSSILTRKFPMTGDVQADTQRVRCRARGCDSGTSRSMAVDSPALEDAACPASPDVLI